MKKTFFDRYGIALIIIAVGVWFIGNQLGFSISLGKLILIGVGAAIIMYGLRMIRQPGNKEHEEQQWDHYNPNMTPPPPPPPGDEPFSSVPYEKDNRGANAGTGMGAGQPGQAGQPGGFGESQHKQHYNQQYGFDKGPKSFGSIERSVFIGDMHYGKQHWELKPMNLSAFIGDMKIDLSKAQIPYGETRIQISAFIGDVKVYVPNDVTLGISVQMNAFIGDTKLIDMKESAFMGNYNISTPNYEECERKIYIEVSTFIGDVKVKRVG